MSTEYNIFACGPASGGGVALEVVEQSGRFDLDVNISDAERHISNVNIAEHLSNESLAEIALGMLRVALYNTREPFIMRKWLHARLDECDSQGSPQTPFPEALKK